MTAGITQVARRDINYHLCIDCSKPSNYDHLVATKCRHIFCKNCLQGCLDTKKECPMCRATITNIDNATPFEHYVKIFTFHTSQNHGAVRAALNSNDLLKVETKEEKEKALQEKERTLAVTSITSTPGGTAEEKKTSEKEEERDEEECAVCFRTSFPLYFVMEDEDAKKIGRFFHEGCWRISAHITPATKLQSLPPGKLLKAAINLPLVPEEPDDHALRNALLATATVFSFSALIINKLVHEDKNLFLTLVSLPAYLFIKVIALTIQIFKKTVLEKTA